jgi:putative sterol carrier protein
MPAYATREWLEAAINNYKANPDNQNKHFKGLSMVLTFRVIADPEFGVEKDVYFSVHIENGVAQPDSGFLTAVQAKDKSTYIVAATPGVWKKIIQKKEGFVANFMGGKVKLDQGSTIKFIPLGGKAPALVENFYKIDTKWPDEMKQEELSAYKTQLLSLLYGLEK